jgi:hypothetical protein
MYQPDAPKAVRGLARHLLPGGVMVFQEHDASLTPASLEPFPLHRKAQQWLQRMLEQEGADLHIGFNLHRIFSQAGLAVEDLRAECLVQTPDSRYALADIVRACLPRIIEQGVASAGQVGIDTLQARLDAEREGSGDLYRRHAVRRGGAQALMPMGAGLSPDRMWATRHGRDGACEIERRPRGARS